MNFRISATNLGQAFDPRKNSLGFLRFFLSILVVWRHSYVLGDFGIEPLANFSNQQVNAGSLAVHSFFAISGFLITRSYLSQANFRIYLWHRVLRIFPGFWVCLLVTAGIIAPTLYIHSHGSINGFFSHKDSSFGYIFNNFLLSIKQPDIANLMSSHPEKSLNGSLWTLEWEFILYLFVAILGVGSILKRWKNIFLGIFFIIFVTYLIDPCHCRILLVYWTSSRLPPLILMFFSGSILWLYKDKIWWDYKIFLTLIITTLLSMILGFYLWIEVFSLPYIIFWLALNLPWHNFDKHGDYSYGVYIYSFPIQQLLIQFGIDRFGVVIYFLLSILITMPLAILSWNYIEKPCLGLKKLPTINIS